MANHEGCLTKALDMRCRTGRPVSILTEELWGDVGNVAAFTRRSEVSLEPPVTEIIRPGWNVTSMDVENGGAVLDLCLALIDQPDGTIGRAQCNSEPPRDDTITDMLRDLETVLETFSAHPQLHLSDLPDRIERGRG